MIRLAFAGIRRRPGGFIGLAITACLTVALFTLGGLLLFAALFSGPGQNRFAAAPVTIAQPRAVTITTVEHRNHGDKEVSKSKPLTGAASLPTSLASRVAGVNGVRDVVQDYAFPVSAHTAAGTPVQGVHGSPLIAHGWSSARVTPLVLRSGAPPGPGQAVVDPAANVRIGDRITILTKTGTHALTVSGITSRALDSQGSLFVDDSAVHALSGLSGPTALAVFDKPGVSVHAVAAALRSRVDGASVYTGANRVSADIPGGLASYVDAISVVGIMLGVTGFAALFVIVGAAGIIVAGRLRELALLRTIGAKPGQLLRMIALEIGLVCLLLGIPGAALGVYGAGIVAGVFRTSGMVPPQFEISTNAWVILMAIGAGVLVGVGAAMIAAARATKIAPAAALREIAVAPRGRPVVRSIVGVVLAAGSASILVFTPLGTAMGEGMSFLACVLLLCSAVAFGPLLVRLVGALLAPLATATGTSGRLAAAMVRTNTRRVASVAMPLMLLVGLVATLTMTSALAGQLAGRQDSARTAEVTAQLDPAAGGMTLESAKSLATGHGVTGAAATIPTTIMVDSKGRPQHYSAQGLDLVGADPLDLDVTSGRLSRLGQDDVAVSRALARAQHWSVGERVGIWLPDAEHIDQVITAVYAHSEGFGSAVLAASLVAEHDPKGLVTQVYLEGTAPASAALASAGLRRVDTTPTSRTNDETTQNTAYDAMTLILLGFVGIAIINAFAQSVSARRREFGDLRLAGATAGQVRRVVDLETALTVGIGVLLGCAVAATVFGSFSLAQQGFWSWIASPREYWSLVGGAVALGLVAGAIPTRLVIRRRAMANTAAAD